MKDTTISVDVAKSVFEIAVSLHPGYVAETHRLSLPRFAAFFAARQPTTVVMEACGMAPDRARAMPDEGRDRSICLSIYRSTVACPSQASTPTSP